MGRIEDEPPLGSEGLSFTGAAPEADGSMVLDGLTRLEELEEIAGIRLAESIHEEVATLGGLIMQRLGRMPDVGDEVTVVGRQLRVEALDGRRVARVRILRPPHAVGLA